MAASGPPVMACLGWLKQLFLTTGNGNFDANVSGRDYGDSMLENQHVERSDGRGLFHAFQPSHALQQ